MNNETLEKHFDLAFSAPNGVQKLRELILTFAMQGKLVPQDPNDQPASELLKAIEQRKQRLIEEDGLRTTANAHIEEEEEYFGKPHGWEYCRLGNLARFIDYRGRTPKKVDSGIPLITAKNVRFGYINREPYEYITEDEYGSWMTRGFPKHGDLLFTTEAPLGNIAVIDIQEKFALAQRVICLQLHEPEIAVFLKWLIMSIPFQKQLLDNATGMTATGIKSSRFKEIPILLPPLAEQHRIVAKIDRLMAQCDELENLGGDRNQKRITIHTAAIDRLLAAQADRDFSTAWDFIQQHFGELYSVKENVAELRKAILQLAVMGKLVPQDPNDEPASELLKAIEEEKQELVKGGKIRQLKSLPKIKPQEVPYRLSQGWEWVRLGYIGEFINGDRSKNYPNRDEYINEGVPWINTGHIKPDGSLTQNEMNFISRDKFDSLYSGKIKPGDLVYCLRGATFGKTAIVDPYIEGAIASSLMIIRPFSPCSNRYLYRYLTSPIGKSQIFKFDNGSAQPNLSANSVRLYVYPLSPLAEQYRIVTKIDQLMALCDELEQQIDAATDKRTELLNALMAQV
jgi:type I restriction enzyme, S subunit